MLMIGDFNLVKRTNGRSDNILTRILIHTHESSFFGILLRLPILVVTNTLHLRPLMFCCRQIGTVSTVQSKSSKRHLPDEKHSRQSFVCIVVS